MKAWLVTWVVLMGCREPQAGDDRCSCTPGNLSTTQSVDEASPMDGVELVARLRRHRSHVTEGRNPRARKVYDDELKLSVLTFCHPCEAWVADRMTLDEMFPLERLDEATRGVCMGLVLRDGTIAYGEARPRACR